MSVLCVIQARLGSTRLPQKSLAWIGDRTLIDHVFERALLIQQVDQIVLAVPAGESLHAWETQVPVAEADVLGRFAWVAEQWPEYDTIVRLTGDCPMLSPEIADLVITLYRDAHAWYAWNVAPGYTDGEDVEVFKREALMRAHREATDPSDREHVTSWIRRNYPVVTLTPAGPRRRKTSVDTVEDLEYVRRLYAQQAQSV